jgi:hypothetical protein
MAMDCDYWYCVACEKVGGNGDTYVPLEEIQERVLSGVNPFDMNATVRQALQTIPYETCVRGFETRRKIMEKVLEVEGRYEYDAHWRETKKEDKVHHKDEAQVRKPVLGRRKLKRKVKSTH